MEDKSSLGFFSSNGFITKLWNHNHFSESEKTMHFLSVPKIKNVQKIHQNQFRK